MCVYITQNDFPKSTQFCGKYAGQYRFMDHDDVDLTDIQCHIGRDFTKKMMFEVAV